MERRSLRIALLLDQVVSDYQLDIINGVRRALSRVGARLIVVAGGPLGTAGKPNERNFVFDMLEEAAVDGLVVLSGSLSNQAGIGELERFLGRFARIPAVTIGVEVPGIPGVSVDNVGGSRRLVTHLAEVHGARRVAVVRGPESSVESQARLKGLEEALAAVEVPLKPEWIVPGGLTREDGMSAIESLFSLRGVRPSSLDAIVCVNDESALGALDALHRRGISVPKPLAIVGFDDAPSAQIANPPLTTIGQRVMEQGEVAASLLSGHLTRGAPLVSKVLEASLVVRESCGCRPPTQNDSRDLPYERPKIARTLRLALIERRAAIVKQLARAGRGRIVGAQEWEGRLVDALSAQVDSAEGGAFFWELERLTRLHAANGGDPIVCHDVLTELRIQALVCVEVEPDLRPRLEDLFQESRLTLARVGSSVVREHVDTLAQRMRVFTKDCLSQVGSPSIERLRGILDEQMPEMGIPSYCLSRFSADGEKLEVLASRAAGLRAPLEPALPRRSLGHDPNLEMVGTTLVVPLAYAERPLGTLVVSWGATDPYVYEEIRDLLGMVLFVIDQAERRDLWSTPPDVGFGP